MSGASWPDLPLNGCPEGAALWPPEGHGTPARPAGPGGRPGPALWAVLCLGLLLPGLALAQGEELTVNLKARVLPVFAATMARDAVLRAGRTENSTAKGRLKAGQKVQAGYLRQGWLAVFDPGAKEPQEAQAKGYVAAELLRLPGMERAGMERAGRAGTTAGQGAGQGAGQAGQAANASMPGKAVKAAKARPLSTLTPEEAAQTLYLVQAAAFPDRTSAEGVARILRKQGFDPRLLSLDGGDEGVFSVVVLGAFPDKAAALALAERYLGRSGKVARVNTLTRGAYEQGLTARP